MYTQSQNIKRKILQHYTTTNGMAYENTSFAETQYFEGIDELNPKQKTDLDFSFFKLDILSYLALGSMICFYGILRYTNGKSKLPKSQSFIVPKDCTTKIIAFVPKTPDQFKPNEIPQVFSFEFKNGINPFEIQMPMILCPTGTFEVNDDVAININKTKFIGTSEEIEKLIPSNSDRYQLKESFSKIKTIEKPFLLCAFETPQGLYTEIMNSSKVLTAPIDIYNRNVKITDTFFVGSDAKPTILFSYLDVIKFCNKLSTIQGLTPYYEIVSATKFHIVKRNLDANGYRLPTQNEWEYAAKAGTNNRWSGTNQIKDVIDYANTSEIRAASLCNVGGKPSLGARFLPNEWGFYLMTGNAAELCDNVWVDYDITPLGKFHEDMAKAFIKLLGLTKDEISMFFKASQKNRIIQHFFSDVLKLVHRSDINFDSKEAQIDIEYIKDLTKHFKKNKKKIFVKGSEYPCDFLFPYKNRMLYKGGSYKDSADVNPPTDKQTYNSLFTILTEDNKFKMTSEDTPITFRLARTITKPSDLSIQDKIKIK